MSKKFSVVVLGATGFTGKLVTAHLLKNVGSEFAFAIAGRSSTKLEAVKTELASTYPSASSIPTIVADSSDETSLRSMLRSTDVVLTTVGPYSKYGRLLVKLCAELGVDYCDLTGEVPFIRDMIAEHHEQAKKSGARIVMCCGFDSVPFDLGARVACEALKAKAPNAPGIVVETYVMSIRGGVSGGTIASLSEVLADPSNLRCLASPYALCPGTSNGSDSRDTVPFVGWASHVRRWISPFVMAGINAKVVRRSNELLGFLYAQPGKFSYTEHLATTKGKFLGLLGACAAAAGFYVLSAALLVPPLRKLIAKLAPQPGEGPSKAVLEGGHARILVHAQTLGLPAVTADCEFTCERDPGYADTSVMIAECALAMASLRKEGKTAEGCVDAGVLTPAAALGPLLRQRLARHNIAWTLK